MAGVVAAISERRQHVDDYFVATHVVAHQRESFSLRSAAAPGSALRLQNRPLAALLPGGGVAEEVFTTSINSFLNIYNTILVARLVLTWFPSPPQFILQPLATLADPYLNAFRGLLPAVGGLDLSPILAFTVLNVVQSGAAALPAELSAARKLRVPKLVKADSTM